LSKFQARDIFCKYLLIKLSFEYYSDISPTGIHLSGH